MLVWESTTQSANTGDLLQKKLYTLLEDYKVGGLNLFHVLHLWDFSAFKCDFSKMLPKHSLTMVLYQVKISRKKFPGQVSSEDCFLKHDCLKVCTWQFV